MKSLKKTISALTLVGVLSGGAGGVIAAPAEPLPASPADASIIARKCARLADAQVAQWGNVERWQLLYLWKSAVDAAFEFQPMNAYRTEQFCSRLRLLRANHVTTESVTFLCTVANRGSPTEVWSFGNRDAAAAICHLSDEGVAMVDRKPPLAEGSVNLAPRADTNRPVSPVIRK